jgi:hypothetical protein
MTVSIWEQVWILTETLYKFQETATNISHRRVGTLAKQSGNGKLAKMCGVIAADEARHAKAYKHFVAKILKSILRK